MLIERDYFGLVKHINRVLRIRVWHGIMEEGIIKYELLVLKMKCVLICFAGGCGGASGYR